ncbi:MAG: alcohol dehydrogenase catalytic domain-containing protein [Planctomycetia bacterium]|nr:alcohol dehydrogenase catalytic domain-containing protein [Planctomycetia bacterium]
MHGVAAFPGSSAPRLVEAPTPDRPAPGTLLLRSLELGICGTDREILASEAPLVPPGSEFLVLGHECLAEVVEAGRGTDGWKSGDLAVPVVRRVRPSYAGPPRRVDLLPVGAYTERGIVEEHGFSTPFWLDEPRHLLHVDPKLRSVAVLTEPIAVASKAVHEAIAVQEGRLPGAWRERPPRVLVTGLGPIGFAAVLCCVVRGWPTTICGRDRSDQFRPRLAERLDAKYLPAEAANWDALDVERDGFDLILECTGQDDVIVAASAALASCGVMCWLGSSRRPEPRMVNLPGMVRWGLLRNHVYVGIVNSAPRDFAEALRVLDNLHRSHPDALTAIITARAPLAEAPWHFANRQPQGIKAVVVYEA